MKKFPLLSLFVLGLTFAGLAHAENDDRYVVSKEQKPICEQRKDKNDYGSEFFHKSADNFKTIPQKPENILFSIGNFLSGTACGAIDSVSDPKRTLNNVGKGLNSAAIATGGALKSAGKFLEDHADKEPWKREEVFGRGAN